MPELPEVEIARRNLERWARGLRVEEAEASDSRLLGTSSPASFRKRLQGRSLEAVERRGKFLLATFDGEAGLLSHLGMDGRWLRRGVDEQAPAYSRARLLLDDGHSLFYASARLLGRLVVGNVDRLRASKEWSRLGLDPLRDRFTPGALGTILAGRRAPVKNALMNQRLIAGLGNIQAAEALWLARIHPATAGQALSRKDIERLHRGIMRSLNDTMAEAEGEEVEYRSDGGGNNPFRVYGREGEPCLRCKTPVTRILQAGRGTFFCPACQPPPSTI